MKTKVELYNDLYDMVNYTHLTAEMFNRFMKENYTWVDLCEDDFGRKLLMVVMELENEDNVVRYFVVDKGLLCEN